MRGVKGPTVAPDPKTCTGCHEAKPVSEFTLDRGWCMPTLDDVMRYALAEEDK